jgi:hypothetical protein
MRSNKGRKFNVKKEQGTNKILRCKLLMRPVLEQETCSNHSNQKDNQTNKNCKSCIHSF